MSKTFRRETACKIVNWLRRTKHDSMRHQICFLGHIKLMQEYIKAKMIQHILLYILWYSNIFLYIFSMVILGPSGRDSEHDIKSEDQSSGFIWPRWVSQNLSNIILHRIKTDFTMICQQKPPRFIITKGKRIWGGDNTLH
jgi:hypothetical protein